MPMSWKTFTVPAALALSTAAPSFAVTYLSVEQAQKLIFLGAALILFSRNRAKGWRSQNVVLVFIVVWTLAAWGGVTFVIALRIFRWR